MKKVLSVLLSLSLACSLFVSSAFAVAGDYSMTTSGDVTVDGTTDKTVTVNFNSVAGGKYYSLEGDWSKKETESTSYLKLTGLTAGSTASPMENDPNTGRIVWTDNVFSGDFDVTAGSPIWAATYTVDKDTPTGEYTVSFSGVKITDKTYDGEDLSSTPFTAKINVTNTSSTPSTNYTVSMAPSATSVTAGNSVTITIKADKAVNGFWGTVAYDADYFTCAEDTGATGKIELEAWHNTPVTTIKALTFTAKGDVATAKACSFAFDGGVKVGNNESFKSDNIPATATGTSVTVNLKAPTTYSVTIADATNGTVTANPTSAAEGTPVTLTVSPATGYELDTLTVTYGDDNTAVTASKGTDGKYTFTMPAGNVTVTATFKAKTFNVTLTGATGVGTATYNKDYTATINNYDADNYDYTVTVTIGGTVYTGFTNVNGAITIPGTAVTGEIVIIVTATPKETFTVSVHNDYVTGVAKIVVEGSDANGYTYNGSAMYKIGNGEYAYLVETNGTLTDDGVKANVAVADESVTCIDLTTFATNDVNGTNKVDFNDAGAAFACYNKAYSVTDDMAIYLRADVTGDNEVDTEDVAAIMTALKAN